MVVMTNENYRQWYKEQYNELFRTTEYMDAVIDFIGRIAWDVIRVENDTYYVDSNNVAISDFWPADGIPFNCADVIKE